MTLKVLILTLVTSFLIKTSDAFVLEALNNQNTTDECSDDFENCGLLDPTFYCFGDYYIWALDNCVKTCNLCHVRASENNETTSTQVEGCKYHGQNFVEGENWIDGCQYNCTCVNGTTECEKFKCPFYINLPSGVHLVKPLGECCSKPDIELQNIDQYVWHPPNHTYAAMLFNQNISFCMDKNPNCGLLDPSYYCVGKYFSWAMDNCVETCGLCDVPNRNEMESTQEQGCTYKGKNYTQGEYWTDGCQYNCTCVNGSTGEYECKERCPKYTNLPPGMQMIKRPGECCAVPGDGQIDPDYWNNQHLAENKCINKNQTNIEGHWWKDGCSQRCECIDNDGNYSCRAVCLSFNLPPICHLEDPPQGMCCKQPRCPSEIVIKIPKQYKDEYPGYTYV